MSNKEDNVKMGGARKGAGRKAIYKDPVSITFSLERTHKEVLRNKFGSGLNQKFNEWIMSILDKKQ